MHKHKNIGIICFAGSDLNLACFDHITKILIIDQLPQTAKLHGKLIKLSSHMNALLIKKFVSNNKEKQFYFGKQRNRQAVMNF